MRILAPIALAILLLYCQAPVANESQEAPPVETGPPASVMLTAYSTTLFTDGTTRLRVALTDSLSREIPGTTDSVGIYVTGAGAITASECGTLVMNSDTAGVPYAAVKLVDGVCYLTFLAGSEPAKVKIEARADSLWPGAHEIHVIDSFPYTKPSAEQLTPTTKPLDVMIGADISWLPQLEARGNKFYEDSMEIDAIALLKRHGFNYIRLRVFVNPENEKGYSPDKGFCGLDHTLAMAKRVKDAGMKLLLDFHYSDYWADPQQQYKPLRWQDLDFATLQDSVRSYTTNVLKALAAQGTPPAMVQIGNEINHGLLWPEGHIGNPDQLAALLRAGVEGAKVAAPDMPIMMHIALGGQNAESVFWLDNMFARGVTCDLIGLSYYPRWHGTPADLKANMLDLIARYGKPLNVVEYSDFKREVHAMVASLPDGMGKGACIWEPLNHRSGLFDREGHVTELMGVYDEVGKEGKAVK